MKRAPPLSLWIVIAIAAAFFLFAFGGTDHVTASTVVDPQIDAATIPAADTDVGVTTAESTLPGAIIEQSATVDVTTNLTIISDIPAASGAGSGTDAAISGGSGGNVTDERTAQTTSGGFDLGTSWIAVIGIGATVAILTTLILMSRWPGRYRRRLRRGEVPGAQSTARHGEQHHGQPTETGRVPTIPTAAGASRQGLSTCEHEGGPATAPA
jgi:hypothetical protein